LIANETNLNSTEKPKMRCENRGVEAEREGWSKVKVTRLCVCTQQQYMRSVAAPSGERAERAPLTSARAGHKLTTAQHTQHPTTTSTSPPKKLANSPIIIKNLNIKLKEYALVNGPHAQ
jgi:hypothetical protein